MYQAADYRGVVKLLRKGADKIIAIGPYTRKRLIQYGLDEYKITPVLNGVDVNEYLPITKNERKVSRELLGFKKMIRLFYIFPVLCRVSRSIS